jgi:energy-coupling factor transport system permease protein
MNQFEYLARISFGQYLPTGSFIHRLDPRAKLVGYFLLIMAISLSKQTAGLLTAIFLILALLIFSKVSLKYALQGLLPPPPFLMILAILQLFITPHPTGDRIIFSWWILVISITSIRYAILLILRFTSLILLLTLVSVTLSTLEIIHGLDALLKPLNKIGIHTDSAAMVVQIMLRFIPFLAINAEKIAKSQASRGAEWDDPKGGIFQRVRYILPLIIPLFIISLHQADTLANAMLARGYGSSSIRTGLHEYKFKWKDLIFILFCGCAAFLILLYGK